MVVVTTDFTGTPYQAFAEELLRHLQEHDPESWADATILDVGAYCDEQAADWAEANGPDPDFDAVGMLMNAFDNHRVGADYCELCDS